MAGLCDDGLSAEICRRLNLPLNGEEYHRLRNKLFSEKYIPNFKLVDGALDYLKLLKQKGKHIAIASSSAHETFQ